MCTSLGERPELVKQELRRDFVGEVISYVKVLVGALGIEPRSQLWRGSDPNSHSFHLGLLAFPRQGAFLGHIHTPELRLRIVWVNLLMIPRDYPSCTSSLARICGSMNLAMSAQIFLGGWGRLRRKQPHSL